MSLSFSHSPNASKATSRPFKVNIPDDDLQRLKTLLGAAPLGVETWENKQTDGKFGVSRVWLANARSVWLNDFDWRRNEAEINSFPHFRHVVEHAELGKFDVHFCALFSKAPDAIPMVMLHGWPGSFLEFLPIMSLLRKKYTASNLPYHIIVPSLPGFAFSSGPPQDRDFTTTDCAWVINQLMIDLGFDNGYVAQGGDFGCAIANVIAVKFEACVAQHVNLWMGDLSLAPSAVSHDELTEKDREAMARLKKWQADGGGYAVQQGTRPATTGLVISSSPLALLAWVGEKLVEWSDATPPLETILEMISLYWFTDTISRSLYPYRSLVASFQGSKEAWSIISLTKPYGYSCFYKENAFLPKAWAKVYPNIAFYGPHEDGGHFVAMEQPETLLHDIEDFIKAHVKVRNGKLEPVAT